MTDSSKNKRIARNTMLLYVRTLFTMCVSLYTSRVILRELGADDFGIYNVVAGVVVMFSFLNGAMASATQRYFSFALGRDDFEGLRKLFSTTLNIHFLIGGVGFILAEAIGVWFVNTQLTIPADRLLAANWVFQFSILTFLLNVVSVPYNAIIISHERMDVFAYVGVFEVCARLGAAYLLALMEARLIFYGFYIFLIALIVRIFYGFYCRRHFPESRYVRVWDPALTRELIGYAGWNLFGNMAAVGFTQGINILLNIFFGPLLNAANGIATQVNSAITGFVGNFQMALNPRIVKSHSGGEADYMQRLILVGSRLSYYLLLVMVIPVLFRTDLLLTWWLKDVPAYTVMFTRLILINALVNSLSGTLMTAAQATGRIRLYQALVGGILLLNLPVSWFLLRRGADPQITMYVMIGFSVLATFARLFILRRLGVLSVGAFLSGVLLRVSAVTLLTLPAVAFLSTLFITDSFWSFLAFSGLSVLITLFVVGWVGLSSLEKEFLRDRLNRLKTRLNH